MSYNIRDISKEVQEHIFYQSNTYYEITINPEDRYQYFGAPRRLEKFIVKSQSLLRDSLGVYDTEYELVTELSEPYINVHKKSPLPRLHFHGKIKFKTDVHVGLFLLNGLYLLSRFALVTINKYRKDKWTGYIHKQNAIMVALSKQMKVPYILHSNQKIIVR